ncbi:MAG: class IV adenylate cyclase [Planctomycetota bacterium]|jgi:adenylate cyclase class 2
MFIEIEAKIKVDSVEPISKAIEASGAEFSCEMVQKDSYFDKDSRLKKGDRALRLRVSLCGENKKCVLAYKGPSQKSEFKKRQEIEIEVSNSESTEELLKAIGYEKVLTFEKKRKVWQLDGCEVVLDELPLLGYFVEIEGPDAAVIAQVQKKVGLADLTHIRQSYADLIENKLHQLGRECTEVLL